MSGDISSATMINNSSDASLYWCRIYSTTNGFQVKQRKVSSAEGLNIDQIDQFY
jgi:hypothetical protein